MNLQMAEGTNYNSVGTLSVHSMFTTIQGEGPFAGHPAIFIRLAGCNLQCPNCDTDYTSDRYEYTPEQLLHRLTDEFDPIKLIVLTGGEPLRQNIVPFLMLLWSQLKDGKRHIQIETNGTLFSDDLRQFLLYKMPNAKTEIPFGCVSIVCSPKGKIHPALYTWITCYKFVISSESILSDKGLPLKVLGNSFSVDMQSNSFQKPIYIQPEWNDDNDLYTENLHRCIDLCYDHGYILSVQLHKYIGVE